MTYRFISSGRFQLLFASFSSHLSDVYTIVAGVGFWGMGKVLTYGLLNVRRDFVTDHAVNEHNVYVENAMLGTPYFVPLPLCWWRCSLLKLGVWLQLASMDAGVGGLERIGPAQHPTPRGPELPCPP